MNSEYLNNFLQRDSIIEAIADKNWSYVFDKCSSNFRNALDQWNSMVEKGLKPDHTSLICKK